MERYGVEKMANIRELQLIWKRTEQSGKNERNIDIVGVAGSTPAAPTTQAALAAWGMVCAACLVSPFTAPPVLL